MRNAVEDRKGWHIIKLPVAFHKQLKIRLLIVFIIDIVMHCKHLLNKRNIPVNRHCMYVCIQK